MRPSLLRRVFCSDQPCCKHRSYRTLDWATLLRVVQYQKNFREFLKLQMQDNIFMLIKFFKSIQIRAATYKDKCSDRWKFLTFEQVPRKEFPRLRASVWANLVRFHPLGKSSCSYISAFRPYGCCLKNSS